MALAKGRELSVLIIGKSGNGRSSLANAITGREDFPVARGMSAATVNTQAVSAFVMGLPLKVIDTADFFSLGADKTTAAMHVRTWKEASAGSPDVIILTVRCDRRYTKEEHAIYQQIVHLWGDKSIFRRRLMVAFTFGDRQDEDIKRELKKVCKELQDVLKDAQVRYAQINNEAWGAERQEQREAICRVIVDVINTDQKQKLTLTPTPADRELSHQQQQRSPGGRPPLTHPAMEMGPGNTGNGNDTGVLHQVSPYEATRHPADVALVLVGKAGHGKSSLGNLIAGNMKAGSPYSFPASWGPLPVTTTATALVVSLGGKRLRVVDTPDLIAMPGEQGRGELDLWRSLTDGLPVVIVVVIRCDVRLTPQDLMTYRDVIRNFNDPRGLIVVFTFCDSRRDFDPRRHAAAIPELNELLKKANSVVNVSNSDSAPEREKWESAQRVLASISKCV